MGLMEQNRAPEKMNARKRQEKINSWLVLGKGRGDWRARIWRVKNIQKPA